MQKLEVSICGVHVSELTVQDLISEFQDTGSEINNRELRLGVRTNFHLKLFYLNYLLSEILCMFREN